MEETKDYEEIKSKLNDAEKNFDEKTMNLICNFVEEFDPLFGKYIDKNELINRIINNLDEVVLDYDFNKEPYRGTYISGVNLIRISNKVTDEEELKSVFFHEMIHCIRQRVEIKSRLSFDVEMGKMVEKQKEYRNHITGFKKRVSISDMIDIDETYESEDEYYNDSFGILIGSGLEEGFTQMCTKIRDKKYAPNGKIDGAYPVLSQLTELFSQIYGEDEFLNMGFNNPSKLYTEDIQSMGIQELDFNRYLTWMDVIKESEKKIVHEDAEQKLLRAIFGTSVAVSPKVQEAALQIAGFYENVIACQSTMDIEKLNELCNIDKQVNEIVKASLSLNSVLVEQLKKIKNSGITNEQIIDGIATHEYRHLVDRELYISDFEALTNEEKLKIISDPKKDHELGELGIFGDRKSLARMLSSIFGFDDFEPDDAIHLWCILNFGMADTIMQNGCDIDKISLEFIDMRMGGNMFSDRTLCNLFYIDEGKRTYLGTYGICEEDYEIYSDNISEERKKEILKEHPEFANMSLLESQNGQIVGHSDNGKYIDTEEGEGKPVYYVGKYENDLKLNCKPLKEKLYRMSQMKKLDAPQPVIDDAFNEVLECLEYLNDSGIDVRNIQEFIDVNMEEAEVIKKANTIRLKRDTMDWHTDIRKIDSVEETMNEHVKRAYRKRRKSTKYRINRNKKEVKRVGKYRV